MFQIRLVNPKHGQGCGQENRNRDQA